VEAEAEEDEEPGTPEKTEQGLLCYDAKDWRGDSAPVFRRCVRTFSVRDGRIL
jgi:hypothetical protein